MARAIQTNNHTLRWILTTFYKTRDWLWSDPLISVTLMSLIVFGASYSGFFWLEKEEATVGTAMSFGLTATGVFVALMIFRIQTYSLPLVSLIITPYIQDPYTDPIIRISVDLAMENKDMSLFSADVRFEQMSCRVFEPDNSRTERICQKYRVCLEHRCKFVISGMGEAIVRQPNHQLIEQPIELKIWQIQRYLHIRLKRLRERKRIKEEGDTGFQIVPVKIPARGSEVISLCELISPTIVDLGIIPSIKSIYPTGESPTIKVSMHPKRGLIKGFIFGTKMIRFDGDDITKAMNAAMITATKSLKSESYNQQTYVSSLLNTERVWPSKSNLDNAMRG